MTKHGTTNGEMKWNRVGVDYTGHVLVGHTADGDVVVAVEAGEQSNLVRLPLDQATEFHRLLGLVIEKLHGLAAGGKTDGNA